MRILSINFSHDGCGVILDRGEIAAFVSTERFSRHKKHPGLREEDLDELLAQANLRVEDLDRVLLVNLGMDSEELVEFHQRNFHQTWLRFELSPDRDRVTLRGRELPCTVNPNHFLCHSAVAYYFSPFDSALCFSYDAISSGLQLGRGERLEPLELPPTQVGDLYTQISIELGLGGLFGAGKTMGLAPYGRHGDAEIHRRLQQVARRGTRRANMIPQIEAILEVSEARRADYVDGDRRWNAALAYHAQKVLDYEAENYLARVIEVLGDRVGDRPNLCLSGGTALNSVTNQLLFESGLFSGIYLHPACGDDGTALGAALYAWHHEHGAPRVARTAAQAMFSTKRYTVRAADFAGLGDRVQVREAPNYLEETAAAIAAGKVVGWFDGASEIGPRALGHRSLLADPRSPTVRDHLNHQVKRRESFRPFAPSVLEEHARAWFGLDDSPFMLRVAPVLKPGVPAITHADGTARVQTVSRHDNPNYHALIEAFHRRTGVPMVLNTSFNVRREPIVESPADALRSFLESPIDALVFPGVVLEKRSAP